MNTMVDQERDWADDTIQDGWTPVENDPYDAVDAHLVAVEAGPRRRIKVGTATQGGELIPLYGHAATERAITFNEATGKFEYVDAGKLDELSDQRIHRADQPTQPLGPPDKIDLAFAANDKAAGTTRRRRVHATGIGDKTIG